MSRLVRMRVVFLMLCCLTLLPIRAQENSAIPQHKSAAHSSSGAAGIVGLSTERLSRLKAALEQSVHDQQFAGMVYLLARHGKVVQADVCGKRSCLRNADDSRQHFPDLLHDEANYRGSDDDPL